MSLRRLIRSAVIVGASLAAVARAEPPIDDAERARLIKQLQQERDHLDALIRQLQQGRSDAEATAMPPTPSDESEMAGSAAAGERSNKRGGGKSAGGGVLSGKVVVDGDVSPADAVVYVADV